MVLAVAVVDRVGLGPTQLKQQEVEEEEEEHLATDGQLLGQEGMVATVQLGLYVFHFIDVT